MEVVIEMILTTHQKSHDIQKCRQMRYNQRQLSIKNNHNYKPQVCQLLSYKIPYSIAVEQKIFSTKNQQSKQKSPCTQVKFHHRISRSQFSKSCRVLKRSYFRFNNLIFKITKTQKKNQQSMKTIN